MIPVLLALALAQVPPNLEIRYEGVRLGKPLRLNFTGAGVTCTGASGQVNCAISSGGGGGAPTTAQYWTGAADAGLSAEKNLGALATGLVLNTAGVPSAYGGTGAAPANQWLQSLNASGAATWAQVGWANLSGVPSTFAPVDATAGVTGGLRLTGQLGGTATSPTVTGLTCTGCVGATQAAALDAGDTTTGTFAAARIPSAAAATIGGVELDTDLGNTAAAPQVVATHLTSPLPGAQGGGGAALPTCAGTDKLTSNGTTWSCAADVGGTYTLPALTATVLGGVKGNGTTLLCSGTDKMTGFDAAGAMQCAADVSGGGGAGNYVDVSVDFTATGKDMVSTVVTGQAWVASGSRILCTPTLMVTATRSEGDEDAVIEGLKSYVHSRVVGTGFTVVTAPDVGDASGTYLVHCTGG